MTYSIDSRTGKTTNILARFPVDSDRNGILHYTPQFPYKSILQNTVIDFISIRLEDDERKSIDFNGQHWCLTIQLDFQYEKDFKVAKTMDGVKEDDNEENKSD